MSACQDLLARLPRESRTWLVIRAAGFFGSNLLETLSGVQYPMAPRYRDFRDGEVQNSRANVGNGRSLLGYDPQVTVPSGIEIAMPWYIDLSHSSYEQ